MAGDLLVEVHAVGCRAVGLYRYFKAFSQSCSSRCALVIMEVDLGSCPLLQIEMHLKRH